MARELLLDARKAVPKGTSPALEPAAQACSVGPSWWSRATLIRTGPVDTPDADSSPRPSRVRWRPCWTPASAPVPVPMA